MIIENFLKNILDEFETGQNIDIIIEENINRPLAAKIFNNQIVWSDYNLEQTYQTIYKLLKSNDINIDNSIEDFYFVTKCCLGHELGHFLDKNSKKCMNELFELSEKSSECDSIDEFNTLAKEFKQIKVNLEIKAWEICEKLMNFKNFYEEKVFIIIKNYFLQTYLNINYTIA